MGLSPITITLFCSEADEGKAYIVSKVNDTSDEVLKYVSSIGIKLNSVILVTKKLGFDKSVLVTINNGEHLLSKKIADNIFVEEIKKQ